jgi:ABC-type dipeptide/oligopeptide/nickel transport system permease subunit
MKFASLVQNRKALIGLILFGITALVAVFPGLFASQADADTIGAFSPNLGMSTAHLLGTTSYGQD